MPDIPFIEVRNLVKTYKVGSSIVKALDGMELKVEEGEMVAIMGPSGAGKTSLLNMIGGLDRPDKGTVRVKDVEVHMLNEEQRAKFRKHNVGFIFQFFNLIPSLTAIENILVPVMFDREKPVDRAVELLERVGLAGRADHLPGMLSGGERQRIAIARALINDPALILADEPTGNIDSETARSIVSLFKELSDEGKTMLMATHDRMIAGRAKVMVKIRDGRITRGKSPSRSDMVSLTGKL
ncbi:MAG: ABC transporter ATP-binding protein [Candidatus Thermoplasmatota archaeon]|nr:ABC transporter ATP-binding protein [Candidatus Thermoplasmatota archaeon]